MEGFPKSGHICSRGNMCQNVPGSLVFNTCSKRDETLLRMLLAEIPLLAVSTKYMAMPTKSMS